MGINSGDLDKAATEACGLPPVEISNLRYLTTVFTG